MRKEIEELRERLKRLEESETFEKGQWLKATDSPGFLLRYNGDSESCQIGFNRHMLWSDACEPGGLDLSTYRAATDEEIEKALRAEWARRCTEAGVDDPFAAEIEANAGSGGWDWPRLNTGGWNPCYVEAQDYLCNRNGCVYWQGVWAEPKKSRATMFFSYRVLDLGDSTKIGCKVVEKRVLRVALALLGHIADNRTVGELRRELEGLDL